MDGCRIIDADLKEVRMLAIQREPLYKNKLFLSSLSVVVGFVMTVGIIRLVNPSSTAQQSAQTTSERRSSTLIPINASESESASESKSDTASTSGAEDTAAPVASQQPSAQGSWTTTSPSSTSQTSAPSGTSQSSTSANPTPATPATASPDPAPADPPAEQCTIDLLNVICL